MRRLRVLLNLDETLVDRQQAFEEWSQAFLAEVGAAAEELEWLRSADASGYRPRLELAAAIVDRLCPSARVPAIEQRLQLEVIESISCFPGVLEGLRHLRADGAELVLVTNGTVAQQTEKLLRTEHHGDPADPRRMHRNEAQHMMDIERVDPALREATQKLPVPDLSRAWMRTVLRLAARFMRVPRTDRVTISTQKSGKLRMRVYQPRHRTGGGALFWIHGGGLLFGDARQDEALCGEISLDLGIPVLGLVPGAPHGFENWAGDTGPAKALMARAREWLRRSLTHPTVA
ncbi:hypothetical protein [Brachybacterium tyrofermentans]|uniref:HAD family hydrolase n=1 Tax=Brachybacterium tyrofermentans TaxID=47848 RepID=UPI003F90F26F